MNAICKRGVVGYIRVEEQEEEEEDEEEDSNYEDEADDY